MYFQTRPENGIDAHADNANGRGRLCGVLLIDILVPHVYGRDEEGYLQTRSEDGIEAQAENATGQDPLRGVLPTKLLVLAVHEREKKGCIFQHAQKTESMLTPTMLQNRILCAERRSWDF